MFKLKKQALGKYGTFANYQCWIAHLYFIKAAWTLNCEFELHVIKEFERLWIHNRQRLGTASLIKSKYFGKNRLEAEGARKNGCNSRTSLKCSSRVDYLTRRFTFEPKRLSFRSPSYLTRLHYHPDAQSPCLRPLGASKVMAHRSPSGSELVHTPENYFQFCLELYQWCPQEYSHPLLHVGMRIIFFVLTSPALSVMPKHLPQLK